MEPAGLAVGLLGLAGIFSAVVECFEYVQLGKAFGADYGKCILRLDVALLRLCRWASVFGIAEDSEQTRAIDVPQQDFQVVKRLLQQILDTFEDAKRISERYEKSTKDQNTHMDALTRLNEEADLTHEDERLHSQLRRIAKRRQKCIGVLGKARWALYEKKKFDRLIEDITEFVDKLVMLFPGSPQAQAQLCESEVTEIQNDEDLATLQAIAGGDDELLQRTIEAKRASRGGHDTSDWTVEGGKVRIGDDNDFDRESVGHRAHGFKINGSADVWIGNRNKGRSEGGK